MPTGIQLSTGVVVGSPNPIDAKYGPYDTVALALADLTSGLRYQGLTVGIKSGSSIVEYWFKDGVADASLVEKQPTIPTSFDDVLEFQSTYFFPAIGEAGKLYIAKDTNQTYRFEQADSTYVQLNSDWEYLTNKPSTFTPSSHTHPNASTSTAGFMSSTDKTKLDGIAAGAEVNVNADWNAGSGDAQILNKPDVVTRNGVEAPLDTPSSPQFSSYFLRTTDAKTNPVGLAGYAQIVLGNDTRLSGRAVTSLVGSPIEFVIACSNETTPLTAGVAKVTFRAPVAFRLTSVAASVTVAPTVLPLVVDINNEVNSVLLSTNMLSIDTGEKTSISAATAAVINTNYRDFTQNAEITIDIDQAGSGAGLKVILRGTRL